MKLIITSLDFSLVLVDKFPKRDNVGWEDVSGLFPNIEIFGGSFVFFWGELFDPMLKRGLLSVLGWESTAFWPNRENGLLLFFSGSLDAPNSEFDPAAGAVLFPNIDDWGELSVFADWFEKIEFVLVGSCLVCEEFWLPNSENELFEGYFKKENYFCKIFYFDFLRFLI